MQCQTRLCEIVERILKRPTGPRLTARSLSAGQLVYGAADDAPDGLLVVRSGRLRAFLSCGGKEMTLFSLDAGDAVRLHSETLLEAGRDSEIVVIPTELFQSLAQSDPDLALAAMPVIDRMLQRSIRLIEDMAFRDVRQRLIRVLCDTADRDGLDADEGILIREPPRAEDFAMQIGTTRQSVSTVMAELIRDGILHRFASGAMVISDLGRLRRRLATAR